jgi:hypothetical protein
MGTHYVNEDADPNRVLSTFARGYVAALLFGETAEMEDGSREGSFLDQGYVWDDVSPESQTVILRQCADFLEDNSADVEVYGEAKAGNDFYFTSAGHGCGFWDGMDLADVRKRLTDASRPYGTPNLYIGDDGRLYYS